jgi:hypothetical protein
VGVFKVGVWGAFWGPVWWLGRLRGGGLRASEGSWGGGRLGGGIGDEGGTGRVGDGGVALVRGEVAVLLLVREKSRVGRWILMMRRVGKELVVIGLRKGGRKVRLVSRERRS